MKHRMVHPILITLLLLQIGLNISKDVSDNNNNFLVPIFSHDAPCCPFKKVGDINYKLLKDNNNKKSYVHQIMYRLETWESSVNVGVTVHAFTRKKIMTMLRNIALGMVGWIQNVLLMEIPCQN